MRRVKFSVGDLATLKKPFDYVPLKVVAVLGNNQFACEVHGVETAVIDKKEMRWARCSKIVGGRRYARVF